MIRSLLRRGLRIGVVVGAILLLIQIFLRNPAPSRTGGDRASRPQGSPPRPREPRSEPSPAPGATEAPVAASTPDEPSGTEPEPEAASLSAEAKATAASTPEAPSTLAAAWVDPEDGVCPVTHPVKVKLASGIFHVPGGLAYDRTTPDRCYRDIAAAEADGFRPSKR